MSYSASTLAAFSAALGVIHASAGREPGNLPPRRRSPRSSESAADRAMLEQLLAEHRRLARAAGKVPARRASDHARRSQQFQQLRELGLTRRQCEVLFWVAEGKTDAAIALILGCAVKTVGKHLEHIRSRLQAETRLAAARTAREWLLRPAARTRTGG